MRRNAYSAERAGFDDYVRHRLPRVARCTSRPPDYLDSCQEISYAVPFAWREVDKEMAVGGGDLDSGNHEKGVFVLLSVVKALPDVGVGVMVRDRDHCDPQCTGGVYDGFNGHVRITHVIRTSK